MAAPAIMAYVGSNSNVVGVTGLGPLPDYPNNQIYFLKEGSGATDGIRQFLKDVPGDETLARNRLEIGSVAWIQSDVGGAQALTYNGQILFVASATSNSAIIGSVRASDLTWVANFGISSGSLAQSDGTRILLPYSFAPLRWGSSDFVVSCGFVSSVPGGEVCILTTDGTSLVNNFVRTLDEQLGVAGRGAVGGSSGTVFILGKTKSYGAGNNTPIGLYVMTQSAILSACTKLGTVSPTQVDATWTNFSGAAGVAYDQVDGNPIILVTTSDVAPVNKTYFVKLDKTSAAVVWKCPVNAFDSLADANMGRNNIVNQRMYYLGSGNLLYTINTATGTATSATISILSASGGQVSEDVGDSLTGFGQWNESATHPVYVGTYMGTLGNHTLGAGAWWRFFPGGLPVPPTGTGRRWIAESGPIR